MLLEAVSRRVFLRRSVVWTAALSSVELAPSLAAAEPTSLVPRRVFFDNPDYINVRVSPDGKTLAWLAPVNRVNNLFVAPIADPAASRAVTRVTGRSLPNFFAWAHTNRHLIFFRDRDGDENFRAYSVDIGQRGGAVDAGRRRQVVPPGNRSQVSRGDADPAQPARQALFRSVPCQHRQRRERTEFENPEYAGLFTDSDFQFGSARVRGKEPPKSLNGRMATLEAVRPGADRRCRLPQTHRYRR